MTVKMLIARLTAARPDAEVFATDYEELAFPGFEVLDVREYVVPNERRAGNRGGMKPEDTYVILKTA